MAAAKRAGLREIGFSDHLPLYFLPPEKELPGYAMELEELPEYVAAVRELGASAREVQIRLGIEADYVPGLEQELAVLLGSQPFDYVLGSIHFVEGWSFDNQEEMAGYAAWNIMELYEKYFALLQQAAMSGLFDVMAHPDLIKKFGFVPEENLISLYEKTVQVFKQAGVGMEINTAGLRYPIGEIYPAPALLQLACRQGVPLTLGSDAHRPVQVGAGFDQAIALLKQFDCHEIALYANRQRSKLAI